MACEAGGPHLRFMQKERPERPYNCRETAFRREGCRVKIVILGGTGMLGSMLVRVFSKLPVPLYASFRDGTKIRPDAPCKWFMFQAGTAFPPSLEGLLGPGDWILNAAGSIPHREEGGRALIQANALLPYDLVRYTERGVRVLQIATDCVFSGECGAYVETDRHDSMYAYGKAKSLGEVRAPRFHHLRCSIVGPELNNKLSLLEWVRSHEPGSEVRGYSNHLWNGITTLAFAKIAAAIVSGDGKLGYLQHVVPRHPASKRALVTAISKHFGLGLKVLPVEDPKTGHRDMTLGTDDPILNESLWVAAGYKGVPGIEELIQELAEFDLVRA